jgi:arsenical-resistance protein 2
VFSKTCLKSDLETLKIRLLIKLVSAGSSRGRGNRAAGWFADYIAEKGDTDMRSSALEEGIKGWATAGDEYVKFMDEYKEEVWTK